MDYKPPKYLFNRHFETIFPVLFRKVDFKFHRRERIFTPDDDFLDLDWATQSSNKLVILSHGLEGSSKKTYILGMSKVFYDNQYDVLAWNYRGCSGEINHQLRFYHSGETNDLDLIINHVQQKKYESITLVGFSLGGNISLKYIGERRGNINKSIKSCITISVPLDLLSCCKKISQIENLIYSKRFLKNLKNKVIEKAKIFPTELSIEKLKQITNLIQFDNSYTAPIHGFKDAKDYYEKCNSLQFIEHITIPTLIINALNDPILSKKCFPKNIKNPNIEFLTPNRGGHIGFTALSKEKSNINWAEKQAMEFLKTVQ